MPTDDRETMAFAQRLATGRTPGFGFVLGEGPFRGLDGFTDLARLSRTSGNRVTFCSSVQGAEAALRRAATDLGVELLRDLAHAPPASVREGLDPRAVAAVLAVSGAFPADRDAVLADLGEWLAGRAVACHLPPGYGARLDTATSRTGVLRALSAMANARESGARAVAYLDGFDARGIAEDRQAAVRAASALSDALDAGAGRLSAVLHATPDGRDTILAMYPALASREARLPEEPAQEEPAQAPRGP